jgi:hypothetical protein
MSGIVACAAVARRRPLCMSQVPKTPRRSKPVLALTVRLGEALQRGYRRLPSMRPPHPHASPLPSSALRPDRVAQPWRPRTESPAEALREIIAWWRGRRPTYRERTNSRRVVALPRPAPALFEIVNFARCPP